MYPAARKPWVARPCHEEAFVERYDRLRRWAVTLTGDNAKADDLLHTAFVQFVLARKDLDEIENLEGYLYGILRRLHLSEARRRLRSAERSLSAIDYDSIESTFRQTEAREYLQVCEELRIICGYACLRKDSSKAGSVLLLRFFHGYYPREIGAILRSHAAAANDWLRIARREARAALLDPDSIASRHRGATVTSIANRSSAFDSAGSVLDELNQTIIASCTGVCLDREAILDLYDRPRGTIACAPLAHIASCPACRDAVAHHLSLRPPEDRGFGEMLGQDTAQRRNGRRAARVSGSLAVRAQAVRHVQDVREHVPTQLQIAVNGIPIGTLGVGARRNDLTLAVSGGEPPDAVEVFSEQAVRMLLMPVERPPDGDPHQSAEVRLSGGRWLSVAVSFDSVWPMLSVQYSDPECWSGDGECEPPDEVETLRATHVEAHTLRHRLETARAALWGRLASVTRRVAPTPALAFGALLACVVAASVFWRETRVSASVLLGETMRSEQRFGVLPNMVVHRVVQLEERRPPQQQIVTRRRIETWKHHGRQVSARRLFDEHNRIVAGDWVVGRSRTTYAPGTAPTMGSAAAPLTTTEASHIWRLEPSAEQFRSLLPASSELAVEDQGDRYVVVYRAPESAQGIVRAALTISKRHLRAVEQVLLIRDGTVQREYRFLETAADHVPEPQTPEAVFDPEPELLGTAISKRRFTGASSASESARSAPPAVPVEELTRVEMRVLIALHRLEPCLSAPPQISSREPRLRIAAQARDTGCRELLEQALASAGGTSVGVQWNVPTLPTTTVSSAALASTALNGPAYRLLYERFQSSGLTAAADKTNDPALTAALALGQWAVDSGHAIEAHAHELQRLVLDWPATRLRVLDLDTGAAWQTMVRDHARRVALEAERLLLQLSPLFPAARTQPLAVTNFDISELDAVWRSVEQIADSTRSANSVLRTAFAAQSTPQQQQNLDMAVLSRDLALAAALSAQFDRPWPIGW